MKKSGYPERGELVICKITKLYPNSAFALLIEYDKTGMIHVSEVASRWVMDIKEFIKENQVIVCKVLGVDKEKNHILLSIKKVNKTESTGKLNEYKKERKAEKMLELAAKEIGMNLQDAYIDIGEILIEEFGSIFKAFDLIARNPDLLEQKNIPRKWIHPLKDIAEKSKGEKVYRVVARLRLISYLPNGVDVIKKALGAGNGIEVKYISASNYRIIGTGKNYRAIRENVEKAAENAVKIVEKEDGEATFNIDD